MTTLQPTETAVSSTQTTLEYVPRHAAWLSSDRVAPAPIPTDEDTLQFRVDHSIQAPPAAYVEIDTSADYVPIKEPRKSWRHRKAAPSPIPTS